MFENYPKKRLQLPENYKAIYKEHYKSNRDGDTTASGIAQKMEQWLHKKVAEDVGVDMHSKRTLEIGAGTLNQLSYEKPKHYDIIEPFVELFKNSDKLSEVNGIYSDISEVDVKEKYDRIISVATFEHIIDLPKVVALTCLLLKDEGVLRTSVPNEGTFLWTAGWKFTTGIEFKLKYNLDYGVLMRYEHVNTAKEIEEILNYFFDSNTSQSFGISKNIAFYRFFESTSPNIKRAEAYLKQIESY